MCGLRSVSIKDQLYSQAERIDIKKDDKVVAINIFNQGSTTMLTSIGGQSTIRQTLPGKSVEYAIPGSVFADNFIQLDFEAGSGSSAVVTTAYDKGEVCD